MLKRAIFSLFITHLTIAGAPDTAWPERPITLIVPFAAGGAVDNVARTLALRLNEQLDQPVLVENRVGAGRLIGANVVANAAADGYTLLMATQSTLMVAPLLIRPDIIDPTRSFQVSA